MEVWSIVLTSLGGTAAALAIAAYLARSFISQLFIKELESYKSELSRENNIAVEKIKASLDLAAKADERSHQYGQIMKRYQGPFQHAIYDLQSRIYNIAVQELVNVYYVNGTQREKNYVINNTAFVIAQYFAWAEIIRNEIQFIDFSKSEVNREFSVLQDNVLGLWRTDEFRGDFKIFAGDQRAIGEVMIDKSGSRPVCMGYARFLEKNETGECALLQRLTGDIEQLFDNLSINMLRLVRLQHALIELLEFLDPEYTRFSEVRRQTIPLPND